MDQRRKVPEIVTRRSLLLCFCLSGATIVGRQFQVCEVVLDEAPPQTQARGMPLAQAKHGQQYDCSEARSKCSSTASTVSLLTGGSVPTVLVAVMGSSP